MADDKSQPIQIYCPVCGYKTKLNDPDPSWSALGRKEKIERLKKIQQSDTPFFTCDGCSDPKATATIMEIS